MLKEFKMKKIALLSLVVFLLVSLFACFKESRMEKKRTSFNAKIEKTVKRNFSSEESFVGTIKSKEMVNVSTKMMGRVLKLYVSEGSMVKKGQLLVEVDAAEALSAYKQSEAGLNAAITASDNANRDLERYRRLYEQRAVTKHQLEQIESLAASMNAQKEQARANLEMAKTLLSYGKIYSPIDGVVTKKFMEEGNLAAPGMPIITIENPETLEILVEVPEEKASKIKVSSTAKLFKSDSDDYVESKVIAIVPVADLYTKTSLVKIEVPKGEFKAGQFVTVRFDDLSREFVSVPKGSLIKEGQLELIFVRNMDKTVSLRIVKSGRSEGEYIQILSGISEGEEVVVSPSQQLKEGDIVEVSQ